MSNRVLLCGYDTETTGLEPGDHRFVEVYAGLWDLHTRKLVFEFNQRIDPQRAISADAQRIHKISASDLVGCPTWDTVGPALAKVLIKADAMVIHNAEFDMKFTRHELSRIGLTTPERPITDTMMSTWATPDGKKPTLGELAFAMGVPYDPEKAHAADYDVKVMMACLFAAIDEGYIDIAKIEGSIAPLAQAA
ncbi:3'-5' exonuclease [Aureimonas sp. AU40]|uniref:3'-5' exonuclease n=1 Tax=Aureimonas sp. AU40 TaxID=1637747 RepID=UPI000780C64A|nr:3'-5' exonuclease [Aureimonas sp. AU40]